MADLKLNSSGGGSVTLTTPSTASNLTLTLPAATSTLLDTTSTQTLTNKTLVASGSNTVEATSGPTSTQLAGNRNKIINGAMMIDQRNAGASVTPTTNGTYTLDRWQAGLSNASKYSIQQSSTAPSGFNNSTLVTSLAATTVAAGDYYSFQQSIEGFNFADCNFGTVNAKTITLSFWVRSSLTGTFGGWIQNANVDRSCPFSYAISSANTWEQKTITIAGDTTGTWVGATNGVGLIFGLSLGMGTTRQGTANTWAAGNYRSVTGETPVVGTNGATFYITGVQLEKGATATPFENRLYGTELALCQRYYWQDSAGTWWSGLLDGGTGDYPTRFVQFPVAMRTAPSGSFLVVGAFYYNNVGSTTFTPSGGGTGSNVTTLGGVLWKSAISNAPGAAQSQKTGQWNTQVSFTAEL